MRVAAGLTIFGHEVRLIFMGEPAADEDTAKQAETLALCDIVPQTTVPGMAGELECLGPHELAAAIMEAGTVIKI